MKTRYVDKVVLTLVLLTVVAASGLMVNPWPRDGWYQTQYFLAGNFLGQDNYTPIAVPALVYWAGHAISAQMGWNLAEEFYLASVLQNLLVLLSACFIYYSLKLLRVHMAGTVAIISLLLVLSTGLPQAFWSENVVLFLMSAVALVVVVVLNDTGDSKMTFWCLALLCGSLIGMLVVTRMTPVFLIPAIALLLLRRMSVLKVAQFTGVLTLITVLMIAATAIGNHARFGRYELSNSSGRHLWQGVREFSDRALANSKDYQSLKRLDPNIEGKDWWDIPTNGSLEGADPREALLKKLAKEAILNEPLLYLKEGAKKFVNRIGIAPYRLGYGTPGEHWNPLDRRDLLPSLSNSLGAPAFYEKTVERSFQTLHAIFKWVYPVTIFVIAISYLAVIIRHVDRFLRQRAGIHPFAGRVLSVAVFLVVGMPLTLIPVTGLGLSGQAIIASGLCILLLAALATILYRSLRPEFNLSSTQTDYWLFSFLILMFFGSLWFSWQIESGNSRNAVPYLPFWAVMLAMSVAHWKDSTKNSLMAKVYALDRDSYPSARERQDSSLSRSQ